MSIQYRYYTPSNRSKNPDAIAVLEVILCNAVAGSICIGHPRKIANYSAYPIDD
jgi:hypothetical protein